MPAPFIVLYYRFTDYWARFCTHIVSASLGEIQYHYRFITDKTCNESVIRSRMKAPQLLYSAEVLNCCYVLIYYAFTTGIQISKTESSLPTLKRSSYTSRESASAIT